MAILKLLIQDRPKTHSYSRSILDNPILGYQKDYEQEPHQPNQTRLLDRAFHFRNDRTNSGLSCRRASATQRPFIFCASGKRFLLNLKQKAKRCSAVRLKWTKDISAANAKANADAALLEKSLYSDCLDHFQFTLRHHISSMS